MLIQPVSIQPGVTQAPKDPMRGSMRGGSMRGSMQGLHAGLHAGLYAGAVLAQGFSGQD